MILSSLGGQRTVNTSFFLRHTIVGIAAGFILTPCLLGYYQACSELIEGVDVVEGTFTLIPANLFGQDLRDLLRFCRDSLIRVHLRLSAVDSCILKNFT